MSASEKSRRSYTAASSLPTKIFQDETLLQAIRTTGTVLPRHLQICPTNRCNLKCAFCSLGDREKALELSWDDLRGIVSVAKEVGTVGCTTTGGGEPLLHPRINDFLLLLAAEGIKVGLVSNGVLVDRLDPAAAEGLTWARISCSDDRPFDAAFAAKMDRLRRAERVDLAFSYVLTRDADLDNVAACVEHARANRFTHVRVVSDIVAVDVPAMKEARTRFGDDPLVILQDRASFERGRAPCRISLLKPVIAADGGVYPCCGAQYAIDGEPLNFPSRMRMGHYRDLPKLVGRRAFFDGSVCDRCFYGEYNTVLDALCEPAEHAEFV